MDDLGRYRINEPHMSERALFPALRTCFFCEKPRSEGHPLIETNYGLGHVQPFPAHEVCIEERL